MPVVKAGGPTRARRGARRRAGRRIVAIPDRVRHSSQVGHPKCEPRVRAAGAPPPDRAKSAPPRWSPRRRRDRALPTRHRRRATGRRPHDACPRGLRVPIRHWRRPAGASTLGPARLDQVSHAAPVTLDRSVHAVDLGHPLSPASTASPQRLLGQLTQQPAPGRVSTARLDIDRPQQLVGKRHHDLGHAINIPGDAIVGQASTPEPRTSAAQSA